MLASSPAIELRARGTGLYWFSNVVYSTNRDLADFVNGMVCCSLLSFSSFEVQNEYGVYIDWFKIVDIQLLNQKILVRHAQINCLLQQLYNSIAGGMLCGSLHTTQF